VGKPCGRRGLVKSVMARATRENFEFKEIGILTNLLPQPDASRRRFLAIGAAASLMPGLDQADAADKSPVKGKDSRLVILKSFPAVLETPTQLLGSRITPLERLFVRNNQQPKDAATLGPSAARKWQVGFAGMVNRAATIDLKELRAMEQVDIEMVLQCSGNGRALFSQSAKTKGTQWVRGGMGNVRFSGVPLRTILKAKGIDVSPQAKYVTAEGYDTPLPKKQDFEHSLPAADVLNHSLLALKINGQDLPAIHGGPVRLITPGVYGTMQMKWLSRLRFEAGETSNYNQIPRYRVPRRPIKPGEKISYTFANSRFNWKMKVKSVVLSHSPKEVVGRRRQTITGVAFNDGSARIDSVLVSLDQGQSWQRAQLDRPRSLFAWTRFRIATVLKRGRTSIWTRAVDSLGRSQPLDGSIHWNPSGYEWNGVEKIDLVVN